MSAPTNIEQADEDAPRALGAPPQAERATRFAGVVVEVPDPAATAAFLEGGLGFGVSVGEDGATWHVTCPGEYRSTPALSVLSLRRGASLALIGVKFDVDESFDLSGLPARLLANGARLDAAAAGAFAGQLDGDGVVFADPNGLVVACGLAGPRHVGTLAPAPVRPRRLGHTNVTVADPGASARFLIEALGLRLSEQIGEAFYFLRVGSEHHNFGIRTGGALPGVHHIGFEVRGWEDYRVLCDHLAELGHVIEYGPGRHGPGHNIFVYVRDPSSGLRLELYADMAHIEDESHYVPPRWELQQRSNTVNRWGPAPPESFLA